MWHRSIWITRKGVERLLGIDNSKVRRMQKSGDLPFVRDENGVCRFPRREIERMAIEQGRVVSAAPGHVAGRAFAFFEQGKTWPEVVVLLDQNGMGQTVDVVRALHAQYREGNAHRFPAVLAKEPASPKRRVVVPPREPDEPEVDVAEPAEDPEVAAWLCEQDEAHRAAQEAFEREQRAWDEERRQRDEVGPRRFSPFPGANDGTPANRAAANDVEPAPVTERIAAIVELLAKSGRG